MSVNKVIIVGNLGQDPELKYTPSGMAVCNLSIATSDKWTDKSGEKQEKTEWHRIVVWGKLADLCSKYLSKGKMVYLEGKLQTRSWEDDNGNKRYMTEINANIVNFLSGNKSDKKEDSSEPDKYFNKEAKENGVEIQTDAQFTADDIPF